MAQNKCPLCGSRVINGSCSECGYTLPDEASIAAPYNYDPSDYNIGDKYAPAEKEQSSMPEIRAYDQPAEPEEKPVPEIKVGDRGGAYPAPQMPQNKAGTYNAQQGTNAPSGQNANPYANFDPTNNKGAQFGGSSGSGGKLSGAVLTELIVGIILTLIFPVLGILEIVSASKKYSKTKDESYRTVMIILIVVLVLRIVFSGMTGS